MRRLPMFAALIVAMISAGCDAIVGAECADGLVFCEGRCATIEACAAGLDAGAMDAAFPDGALVDGALADGALVDGALPDGAPADGGDAGAADGALADGGDAGEIDGAVADGGDAGEIDGAVADGGDAGAVDGALLDGAMAADGGEPLSCDLGEIVCDELCVDALTDPDHCGSCDVACAPAEFCAAGVCRPTCEPPLVACGGRCVDTASDPDHCGRCNNVCASGICLDGDCSDALAGHFVAIGHDYVIRRAGMSRLAGNAVFLARGSPSRVLVFEGGSSAASRGGTDAAIQQVATAIGRTWDRIVSSGPDAVPLELAGADAFVIYAQATTDDATLRAWGTSWARALETFLRRGGVVVMTETSSAANQGTWQIADAAGLFSCTGRTSTTGSMISVVEPADAVALRVPLNYIAERESVRFDTTEPTIVCSDGVGPVVVHRTIVIP